MTSESQYGAWQTALSLLAYLGLLDFGLGVAVVRLVAALPPQADTERLNEIVNSAFVSFCVIAVIFLAAGWWLSGFAPAWFDVPQKEVPAITNAYRLATLAGAIALPTGVFGAVLTGIQKMAVANTVRTVGSVAGLIVSVILLFDGVGITALAISNLVTVLVTGAVCYWLMSKHCPRVKIRTGLPDRRSLHEIWSFGGLFQLAKIANTVAGSADALVIASRLSAAMVTPYSITSKASILCSNTLASKLPIALFPGLANVFGAGEYDKLRSVLRVVLRLSSRLACVAGFLIAVCNERFVSLWVGSQFYAGPILNAVFVYWVAQDTLLRGLGSFVYASGRLRGWAIVCALEAVVNLATSIFLVKSLGLVGVALGTSIARTMTTAWLFWWLHSRIGLSFVDLTWAVMRPLCFCVPGCVLGWVVARALPESLGWLWLGSVVGTTCIANIASFEGRNFIRQGPAPFRQRLRVAAMAELRY
jgi:O-antigen/teichoic acid export membrane protein